MFIEIRRKGNKKIYYLTHSFRDGEKLRKIRRYLGVNLSKDQIKELREEAETNIMKQLEDYKNIRDPLNTILSADEIDRVNKILIKKMIKIKHLSEDDWKKFIEIFTYNTNAIEGSTINSFEVKDILEKDEWPDKPKEEISETYGVAEAIKYIRKTKEHLSLDLMKSLHKIIFKNSKSFAGKFRGEGIEVAVMNSSGVILHRGVQQRYVLKLLKELVKWYEENKERYHPIILAAVVHNQFENIHPFQDGNGRIGRLILNNILLKHNLPPVNIELKRRSEYYIAIGEYENNGNLRPTIELILKEFKAFKTKR